MRAALHRTRLGAELPEHLRRTRLIEPGQTVVVAVSGGADSIALLHALRFLLESDAPQLVAAHFDHAMRPGSAGDAAWVAGVCLAWGVPLESARAEEPPRSAAEARTLRYRFLREVARRHRADRIATAHQADDQAETVLFRAIRGTGLRGLAGIPARRGRIVRPILPYRRVEIEEYLEAARLESRIDPSNFSLDYARNRIRHEVVPRLEAISPGAVDALVRLAAQAREAEAAWDHVLDRLEEEAVLEADDDGFELARPILLSYDPPVRARLLRRLMRRLGGLPDRAGTRGVVEFTTLGASGSGVDVAGGLRVEREFDRIRIRRVVPAVSAPAERVAVIERPGQGEALAVLGGRPYRVRWSEVAEAAEAQEAANAITVETDSLRFPLTVRAWRPGDRIRLEYGSKTLKKLFGERRVGRAERARVPVLAAADGRILWIVGVARSAVAASESGHLRIEITVADAEHA